MKQSLLGVKSVKPNPKMELNMANHSQFSMCENCRNIFLDYIDDIKGDVHHLSKKIQARTQWYDIKEPNSGSSSLESSHEMILKMAKLSQFSPSESSWIIFLHHIDDIRNDICHSTKKILFGTIVIEIVSFCTTKSEEPNHVIGIDQSVVNVKKQLNNFLYHINVIRDDIWDTRM